MSASFAPVGARNDLIKSKGEREREERHEKALKCYGFDPFDLVACNSAQLLGFSQPRGVGTTLSKIKRHRRNGGKCLSSVDLSSPGHVNQSWMVCYESFFRPRTHQSKSLLAGRSSWIGRLTTHSSPRKNLHFSAANEKAFRCIKSALKEIYVANVQ